MTHRLLALLGSIAFGIRRFCQSILSLVGLGRLAGLVVPALVLVLAVGAVVSARETATILGSRPEVTQTTLTDVASREIERGSTIWFSFDAVIGADSFSSQADLGTFFYLARDPADLEQGLLVRSSLNDAFFRRRVLRAELVEDPELVSRALSEFGTLPSGFELDPTRFLDEVEAGGDAAEAVEPSDLRSGADAEDAPQAGSEILVAGRVVSPDLHAACDDEGGCTDDAGSWLYLFADEQGGAAMILRSPHAPDAQPVRLEGLYARDTFDLAPVLDSPWFQELDADVPTERAFFVGSRPPILVPASWVPTIIFAAIALLLRASYLVGYPVFRGGARIVPARTLATGEGIELEISGSLARDQRAIELDRSPGALERLATPELALRLWRYGLLPRDQSRRDAEREFIERSGEADRLVLHERDQSALVIIDHERSPDHVEAGRLYRLLGSVPALRFHQGRSRAYLTMRSVADRDRVASEIASEARPE